MSVNCPLAPVMRTSKDINACRHRGRRYTPTVTGRWQWTFLQARASGARRRETTAEHAGRSNETPTMVAPCASLDIPNVTVEAERGLLKMQSGSGRDGP